MTQEQLMQLSAEKALKELSWKDIEFLFRPKTVFELLLRVDFENTCKLFGPLCSCVKNEIKIEEFYREMVRQRGE